MLSTITLLAKIKLYTDTPKIGPIYSGYITSFVFEDTLTAISGKIDLQDVELLKQGQTGDVHVTFVQGTIDNEYFNPHNRFYITHGRLRFGEGEILAFVKKWQG